MLIKIILELEEFLKKRDESWTDKNGRNKIIQYSLSSEFIFNKYEPSNIRCSGCLNYREELSAGKIAFSPTGNGRNIRKEFIVHLENILESAPEYVFKYNAEDDSFLLALSADEECIKIEVEAIKKNLGPPKFEIWKR
jgi:hypothetical protein